MTDTIKEAPGTHRNSLDHIVQLRQLSPDWHPWKWQVIRYKDGQCAGWINWPEDQKEEAESYFEFLTGERK